MPWNAIFAVVALLFVQAAFAAACLYAYTRIRTSQDNAGQAVAGWAAKVELAVTTADSAKRQVETIEVEKYNRLRTRTDELESELRKCQLALKVCETKISSEERMQRRAASKASKVEEQEGEEADGAGAPTAASLARLGAIPLTAQHAAPAAARAPAPSNFGRVAR